MPYTHVNGIELSYEASGQETPVIFIHGEFPTLATTLPDFSGWEWSWENDFENILRRKG